MCVCVCFKHVVCCVGSHIGTIWGQKRRCRASTMNATQIAIAECTQKFRCGALALNGSMVLYFTLFCYWSCVRLVIVRVGYSFPILPHGCLYGALHSIWITFTIDDPQQCRSCCKAKAQHLSSGPIRQLQAGVNSWGEKKPIYIFVLGPSPI